MGKYDFTFDMGQNDPNALILKRIRAESVILEFGPYKGRTTKYLKEHLGCKVYAVEIDKEAAQECKKYTESILNADIEEFGWIQEFSEIKFDGIIFADVLEHLRKPEKVMQMARQLLKKDGSIYVSIPNITHNSVLINMINNKFRYTPTGILDETHIHFWGYDDFIEFAYKIGTVPIVQIATYCGMDNEIGVDYCHVSSVFQQELTKRRYGHVYQFVFELKNSDYVKEHNISIFKDIRGEEQYQYELLLEGNTEENFAGDFCLRCRVEGEKEVRFNLADHHTDSVSVNILNCEGQALCMQVKGITDTAEEEKLMIVGALHFENKDYIINHLKAFRIPLNKQYQRIELSVAKADITMERYYQLIQNYIKMETDNERMQAEFEKKIRTLETDNERMKIELEKKIQSLETKEKQLDQEMRAVKNDYESVKMQLQTAEQKINEMAEDERDDFLQRMRYRFSTYGMHPRRLFRRIVYKEVPVEAFVKKCSDKKYEVEKGDMVSIVIPIYDRTEVLKESIDSILNQTYKNIELLLVCDGSPNETLEIVESYRHCKRVRIFKYNNNSGNAVRGRNKAIKEARGKYLAFQDSDDIAEPIRIEKSLQYMESFKADVVYGAWRAKVDGTRDAGLTDGQEIISPECDYELLKKVCVPCQSTVMVRVDALRDAGGLKSIMRYREDHELWLRLAYLGYRFKAVPEVLTNLRIHENNLELKYKKNDEYWQRLTMKEHKVKAKLPLKIGYVIAGCGISGGLSVTCTHANYLLDKGYDVSLICVGPKQSISWFPNQKVELYAVEEVEDNYDVLFATYWTTAYQVENMKAKQKIYFIQSDERKFYPDNSVEAKQVETTYKFDFTYMTMAKWCQNWLKEEFGKEAYIVSNGIDENVFFEDEPLEKRSERLKVLIEGPMTIPFKGVKEAFSVLENLECDIWYVSSDGRPDVDWRCDRYFEKVKLEDMRKIYSSCDILLKLSKFESFCLPALEMMACGGIPVVAKVNGINEFLENGINGYIVEQEDYKGAQERIRTLIENKELRNKMSFQAKETAKKWYWKNTLNKLDRFFKTLEEE